MIDIIGQAGGSGVQEVLYESQPDIVFTLGKRQWLLSVKIGQDVGTTRSALLQYIRHKADSGIQRGLIVFFPESVREIPPIAANLRKALEVTLCVALVDAEAIKEERADVSFEELVADLSLVCSRLDRAEASYFPLSRVVDLLRDQVLAIMSAVNLQHDLLVGMLTDPQLFGELGHLSEEEKEHAARFLAAFILMSQILFLRILTQGRPDDFIVPSRPVSKHGLRVAINRVLAVNYRPIFEIGVLDAVSDRFVADTFDLIWGLELERAQHELPGRIFHELMPPDTRKLLAAFYTRPLAADLLARLAISKWDASVCDPACGSGTILLAAYKRKRELFRAAGRGGSPHVRFCEEDIFGADLMPFAVHLTAANLASMDVSEPISRTQIVHEDSLRLRPGQPYGSGLAQMPMFTEPAKAKTTQGEKVPVTFSDMDAVLMNPPFTKRERGISEFADVGRFHATVGGNVGLWGHFVPLADTLLKKGGVLAAVLPVNVLRGTESEGVRRILFRKWTPLYIIKATRNYGFSEWAEYRDILVIVEKRPAPPAHRVKFCLVKKDLTRLVDTDIPLLAEQIRGKTSLRSDTLDIESFRLKHVRERFANMMWFCGASDMDRRDAMAQFVEHHADRLQSLKSGSFSEGFRPVPQGVSKFLFLTRAVPQSRADAAFLSFVPSDEKRKTVVCRSPLGAVYEIARRDLAPTLRTYVGLSTMDVTRALDYIALRPYADLDRVVKAAGFDRDGQFDWSPYWAGVQRDLKSVRTHMVVVRRINPYSPNTHMTAFYSDEPFCPSNQLNVVNEEDPTRAKAMCCILNSCLFWSQFFLLKEESTGRNVDVRFYDLYEMALVPDKKYIPALASIYENFKDTQFAAVSSQLDANFEARYKEFWKREDSEAKQDWLWSTLNEPVEPSETRLEFDKAVCAALELDISESQTLRLYAAIVQEMLLTRRLSKD
jgi:hypothetical protein